MKAFHRALVTGLRHPTARCSSGKSKSTACLVCRFALRPERFWNHLNRNGPQIAHVISDSGGEFLPDGVPFALSLGGDGLISEQTYSVFKAGRHRRFHIR